MIMMIIACYNYNYNYNHVQMTSNHMALSIDDNYNLKKNQQLQLES